MSAKPQETETARVVNLTPHEVKIYSLDGSELIQAVPASGKVARLKEERHHISNLKGKSTGIVIPITHVHCGEVIDLPDPSPGIIYIVSQLVIDSVDRDDVFFPGELVRDARGVVVGCKGLSQI